MNRVDIHQLIKEMPKLKIGDLECREGILRPYDRHRIVYWVKCGDAYIERDFDPYYVYHGSPYDLCTLMDQLRRQMYEDLKEKAAEWGCKQVREYLLPSKAVYFDDEKPFTTEVKRLPLRIKTTDQAMTTSMNPNLALPEWKPKPKRKKPEPTIRRWIKLQLIKRKRKENTWDGKPFIVNKADPHD